MVCTYQNYKGCLKELPIEECLKLHEELAAEVEGDPDAEELYDDLVEMSVDYAVMRAQWTIKEKSWRNYHDGTRTMYHDSLITNFDILARYLRKQGKAAKWRDVLGYDEEGIDRKRIGDFACFLVFIHGINGR